LRKKEAPVLNTSKESKQNAEKKIFLHISKNWTKFYINKSQEDEILSEKRINITFKILSVQ
jgi:hypothetical protein